MAKKNENTKNRIITIRTTERTYQALTKLAKSEGKSMSQTIDTLLAEGLKQGARDIQMLEMLFQNFENLTKEIETLRKEKKRTEYTPYLIWEMARSFFSILLFLGNLFLKQDEYVKLKDHVNSESKRLYQKLFPQHTQNQK